MVSALVTKEQVQAAEIDELVEKLFEGSLPTFAAAFTQRQQLSDAEIDAMQEIKGYNHFSVRHDPNTDMWAVSFGYVAMLGNSHAVYLNSQGITQLIIHGE